ncbi:MAG: WD40 repeat domain-containing protein [Planctomycetes bacterium]|nr:WD40 repeat domain-containing protein [Planctomycetota bacterium]
MRELRVCPPSKRKPPEVVHRLEFGSDGNELVAWAGAALHAYDLRTDTARVLFDDPAYDACDWYDPAGARLSPDRRFVAFAYCYDGNSAVQFVELSDSSCEDSWFPTVPANSDEHLSLMFTADGTELIAVRNHWNRGHSPDVARFEVAALTAPPKGYVEKRNPLTGQTYQAAVRDLTWNRVMTLPTGDITCAAALSANGRLVAAGTENGMVHVVDLKRKRPLASFVWEGRKLRDRTVTRLGFDPAGARVASVAGGRLFVRPLGAEEPWWTKDTLGRANDFAFHPDGHVLCGVFDDGQARFLDPHTGAVRRSFRWAKKPGPLHAVAFAPDGLTCAAGGANGKVVVWDVDV